MQVIALLAVFSTAVYIYFQQVFTYWKKKGVAILNPLPLFGDFAKGLLPNNNPQFLFTEFYRKFEGEKYGGLYRFATPQLLLRDPDIIKNVLVKDFDNFYGRGIKVNAEKEPLAGHLFLLSGPK